MTTALLLNNILSALAHKSILTRREVTYIASRLTEYTDIDIAPETIIVRLDHLCGDTDASVSRRYATGGYEWRLRLTPDTRTAIRRQIDAVYDYTDTFPRDTHILPDSGVEVELYRPTAFACIVAHLIIQRANGNLSVPTVEQMRAWCRANIHTFSIDEVDPEAPKYGDRERVMVAIARNASQRRDPKGAAFYDAGERRSVRGLARKGILEITTDSQNPLFARIRC